MLIQEPLRQTVNEPEIYDRKMMMVPPAAESLHSGRNPGDFPIYPPVRPSHPYEVSQAVSDFTAQDCQSSSNHFVPACYGSTTTSQQSYFSPSKPPGITKSDKPLHERYPSDNYHPTYQSCVAPSSSLKGFNQSGPIDTGTRNCKLTTRESTNTLKNWLHDHETRPYPTKGEKIMLAIVTKMTLTQVSTWFANARRRLKKENKMTWIPKNRSNELSNQAQERNSLEEDVSLNQALQRENGSSDIDDQQVPKSQLNLELTGQNPTMISKYRSCSISKPELGFHSNTYPTSSFNNYGNTYPGTAVAHKQTAHIDVYPNKHQGSGIGDYGNNLSFDVSVEMRDPHCSRSVPTDNNRLNWPANVNSYSTSNGDNELPATMRHYHNVVNDKEYMANSCEAYQVDYHHQRKPEQLMQYKQFNPTFETPTEAPLLPMSAPKYFQNVQPNIANFQSTEYRIQPDQLFNNQSATNISSPFQPELESNSQVPVSSLTGNNEHSMNELLQANPIPPLSNASLSPSDSSSSIFQYNNSSANAATSTETSRVSYSSSCLELTHSPLSQTFSPRYNNFNSEFARHSTLINQSITNEQTALMKLPLFGDSKT